MPSPVQLPPTGTFDLQSVVPGLARLHHLSVGYIAARCQDNALAGIDANVMKVVSILADHARHAAVRILLAFHQHGVVAELGAQFDRIIAQAGAKRHGLVVGKLFGTMARRPCLVTRASVLRSDGALEPHLELAVALYDIGDPVDHRARFVGPQLDEVIVHEAVRVADDILHGLHLVDFKLRKLLEGCKLVTGVHSRPSPRAA